MSSRVRESYDSILIRPPNWVGDQIMAFPFFHFLRKAYPRARIGVACVPWVESIQFRNLVDEVLVLPRPFARDFRSRVTHLEECASLIRRHGGWDLGISLPNSFSSAWIMFRGGVRRRRGYSTDLRSLVLNERVRWNPDAAIHRAQAYLHLLPESALPKRPVEEFWGIPPENDLDEPIPGELERFDAESAWPLGKEKRLKPPKEPYWVLAPGSMAESRQWPSRSFAELARMIAKETGYRGVIVGGPKEAPIGEQLARDPELNLIDLTAQGPIPVLSRIFEGARFTVSNDSGLAHVAALCGSPVQIVWGAGNPSRTRPLGPGTVRIAVNPVECWPCERNVCSRVGGGKVQCLIGVPPETVWQEVKRAAAIRDAAEARS